jgi:hypothetical protein
MGTVGVYRVENWHGAGPYNESHTGLHAMHEAHTGNRPHPTDDGIACPLTTEHCGFSTRADLDWWFRGYKRVLHEYKFNIAFYLVKPQLIRYGHRQIMFERGDLLPVERYPIIRNGKVLR